MSQPTEPIVISDISTVTGVADVIIDGTVLWVARGTNPAGRYWTLHTPDNRVVGLIVEHLDGSYDAVTLNDHTNAATAQDAALLLVATLKGATPEGAK